MRAMTMLTAMVYQMRQTTVRTTLTPTKKTLTATA